MSLLEHLVGPFIILYYVSLIDLFNTDLTANHLVWSTTIESYRAELAIDLLVRFLLLYPSLLTFTTSLQHQTNAETSKFLARYTPVLVDRFLEYPANLRSNISCGPLASSALVLLVHLSPYTIKYVRSRSTRAQSGKRLTSCVAENIVAVAGEFDRSLKKERFTLKSMVPILRGLTLLCNLILTNNAHNQGAVKPDDISKRTRDALLPWLALWSRPYPNEKPDSCQQVRMQMSSSLGAMLSNLDLNPVLTRSATRSARKVIHTCSFPGCDAVSGLKECER